MKRQLRRVMASKAGFTLVEALVGVVIFSFLMIATYSIFSTSKDIQTAGMDLSDAQQNARISLDTIEREIRLAGFGIDKTVELPILVASEYRITFVKDEDGDGAVDLGETITYFLDPYTNDFIVSVTPNPKDMVIRRVASSNSNPNADPISGYGDIVASGITQQTDEDGELDVPLFTYLDASGASLIDADADDPYSSAFGSTISDSTVLGRPVGGNNDVQIASVEITIVTESEAKDNFQDKYERVTLSTAITPRNLPLALTVASSNTFIPSQHVDDEGAGEEDPPDDGDEKEKPPKK
jgi:type II secretory pathway pseudopilin PulG